MPHVPSPLLQCVRNAPVLTRAQGAPAMGLHMTTVHHETLKAVPNAEFGRDDPTINIQGTKNAPLFDDEQIKRMREAAQAGGPRRSALLWTSTSTTRPRSSKSCPRSTRRLRKG